MYEHMKTFLIFKHLFPPRSQCINNEFIIIIWPKAKQPLKMTNKSSGYTCKTTYTVPEKYIILFSVTSVIKELCSNLY